MTIQCYDLNKKRVTLELLAIELLPTGVMRTIEKIFYHKGTNGYLYGVFYDGKASYLTENLTPAIALK